MPCCLKLPVLRTYSFKTRQTHSGRALYLGDCIAGIQLGWVVFALVGTLRRKPNLVKCHPHAGKPEGHSSACAYSDALQAEVMVSRKAIFKVRYLSGQVRMGSKGALDKVARTSSKYHKGVIMQGMPLECRVHANWLPRTIACLT